MLLLVLRVTPRGMPTRFDTWFYAVALRSAPPAHIISADATETATTLWISPSAAVAQGRAGAMALPPPTCYTVQDLSGSGETLSALWKSVQRRHLAPYSPWPLNSVRRPRSCTALATPLTLMCGVARVSAREGPRDNSVPFG